MSNCSPNFSHDSFSNYDSKNEAYERIVSLVSNYRFCVSKDFDYTSFWESSCTACMRSLVNELINIIDG